MEKKYGVPLQKIEEYYAFQKKYRNRKKMVDISDLIPSVVMISEDEKVKIEMLRSVVTTDNDSITINNINEVNNKLIMVMNIKFSEVVVYNVNNKDLMLIIQLLPESLYNKCIFKLRNEQQLMDILNMLPIPPMLMQISLEQEDGTSSTDSSETDSNDSGKEKTDLSSSSNESSDIE